MHGYRHINPAEKTTYIKDSQAVMVSSSNDPIDFNDAMQRDAPSFLGEANRPRISAIATPELASGA